MLFLLSLILGGAIIGALGRLAIPGPNPMSIPMTIAVGIGGMLIGGIVGNVLFNGAFGFLLGVLAAAGIVYLLQRKSMSRGGFARR
jgi:uncharacterized membrane protein YeaQ/YmgE (transglycosylase-associated protein family)